MGAFSRGGAAPGPGAGMGDACPAEQDVDDPPPRRCCVKLRLFAQKSSARTAVESKRSLVEFRKDHPPKQLDPEEPAENEGAATCAPLPPTRPAAAPDAAATAPCAPRPPPRPPEASAGGAGGGRAGGAQPAPRAARSPRARSPRRGQEQQELPAGAPPAAAAPAAEAGAAAAAPGGAPRGAGGEAEEEFFSCDEASLADAVTPRRPSRRLDGAPGPAPRGCPEEAPQAPELRRQGAQDRLARAPRARAPPANKNRISHYRWLEGLLRSIAGGTGAEFAREGGAGQGAGVPLFVVAGACPNSMCGISTGMQAVLFSQLPGGGVDFWWVKPRKDEAGQLEPMFLALHRRGSFKNDPGRSRPIYAPLAEKFSRGADGDFVFGVDGSGRAFIEESREGNARERMLLYLVWQEAWSGVFSSEKFIRGKILYQKGAPGGLQEPGSNSSLFFAREYEIRDGQLTLSAVGDEEILPALLPPDSFQGMCTEFG